MKSAIDKETQTGLTQIQHILFAENNATLILFEGTCGSAMSLLVNEIVNAFEPRNIRYVGIDYHALDSAADILGVIPARGRIGVFEKSWYAYLARLDDKYFAEGVKLIEKLERYLVENGVNIVKIFLDIDDSTLKKNRDTFPVDIFKESGYYSASEDEYSMPLSDRKVASTIELTNSDYAPWDIVEVKEYKQTVRKISEILLKRLNGFISYPYIHHRHNMMEIYHNPREDRKGSLDIDDDLYDKRIKKLQKKLGELQLKLSRSDKALIIMFEGWDAAGKGGIIRRITSALNPRGYRTIQIGAPTHEEKAHTHLWRFVSKIPEKGHITIFDRSWYGRMMVEPIEGFCTDLEYSRAAEEINLFEEVMTRGNKILLKFWIDIDKDVQLERFNARAGDPMKQWKLTDEDWRNRDKWDVYEDYIDSMMRQTNTPYAPWTVIENNSKKYGRIQTLEKIVETLEKELED